jgi:hypothetical protein
MVDIDKKYKEHMEQYELETEERIIRKGSG